MKGSIVLLTLVLCALSPVALSAVLPKVPGNEEWGYIDVRTGAHMFYWLYHNNADADVTNRPLVMWLQGGPGASSTGYGNFAEIGPLDLNQNARNYTWVNYVNVLFVDNPVGTGYSYVDFDSLYTTTNAGIAADLVEFMRQFLAGNTQFQTVPFYIFAESYGGKMAVEFAQELQKAIDAQDIACDFRGVGLGDSWISPIDSVITWAPFLYSNSMVDTEGYNTVNNAARLCETAVKNGNWQQATTLWSITEGVISDVTNGVDFYNILYRKATPSPKRALASKNDVAFKFAKHLKANEDEILDALMNGPIREKLGIPADVIWGGQSGDVFNALYDDFMKPATVNVEWLLNNTNLQVAVYTGQLDLIVDTPGTLKWVEALNYDGLTSWAASTREPIVIDGRTEAFVKEYSNLAFFWILRAGHMVPTDNPKASIELLARVTKFDSMKKA